MLPWNSQHVIWHNFIILTDSYNDIILVKYYTKMIKETLKCKFEEYLSFDLLYVYTARHLKNETHLKKNTE